MPRLYALALQYYRALTGKPKKCARVAHFYETVAHYFGCKLISGQLCEEIYILYYMTKAEIEKKKSLARSLFLSGMEQTEIAEKVDVSRVTISKWCTADGWKEARAAKNVTRPELVNKLLLTIDTLITQVNESNDPALVAGLGDKLAKLSAVIEKLDKKANVVDVIEVFMAFSKWIEYRSTIDPEVTPELVRAINKYQDLYITEQMGIK